MRTSSVRVLTMLAVAARLAAQDPAADYRAGDFAAAHAGFAAAVAARGDAAPPDLRANLALAALRARRTGDAEAAARTLLADGARWRGPAESLLGLAAWQRAEQAVAAARLPDAEPMAWDLAVAGFETAFAHWRAAAAAAPGDGAAVRNAERAWRRLAEARAEREAAAASRRSEPEPPPPAPPEPAEPEAARPELRTDVLSAAEVERLRQRLAARDREKRRLRLLPPEATAGEREW